MPIDYDALLIVSFGGPEGAEDVIPFLENVLRGKNVPRARMLEVAHHYQQFGGRSPLNSQIRQLMAALEKEFENSGLQLPIYWGNRNWHPMLGDTLRVMAGDGVRRALAFVTSAYSSYSGCRQYLEDIERARTEVGPSAPRVDKIRAFYNHPGFIQPNAALTAEALSQIPAKIRASAQIVFTAHSIPLEMARHCEYEQQLAESCQLVADHLNHPNWILVYQSRSGPPHQPWLEPDVCDYLQDLRKQGGEYVVVVPLGFLSDHIEVLYDLDTEARQVCEEIGLKMIRAATVGVHPDFVAMIRELVVERISEDPVRRALGDRGASHDVCPSGCCPYSVSRPVSSGGEESQRSRS